MAFQILFEASNGPVFKGYFGNLCLALRAVVTPLESRCLAHSSLRHFLLVKVVVTVDSRWKDVSSRETLLSIPALPGRALRRQSKNQRPHFLLFPPTLTLSSKFSSERTLALETQAAYH